MSPLRRAERDEHHATKHLSFSERELAHDANENFVLGQAAARKKDHAAAMLHYHMALKLQREIMGHEHPVVAATLNAIGLVLMESGDIDGAQAALQEALYIRQEELRDVADDVAATLSNLSALQEIAFASSSSSSKVASTPEFPPTRRRLVLQDAVFDHAIQDSVEAHELRSKNNDMLETLLDEINNSAELPIVAAPDQQHTSVLDPPLQTLEATLERSLQISALDTTDSRGQISKDDDDTTIATTSTSSTAMSSQRSTDAPSRVGLFSSWFQRGNTCDPQLNHSQSNSADGRSNVAKTA